MRRNFSVIILGVSAALAFGLLFYFDNATTPPCHRASIETLFSNCLN
jgi:hypothetical protein